MIIVLCRDIVNVDSISVDEKTLLFLPRLLRDQVSVLGLYSILFMRHTRFNLSLRSPAERQAAVTVTAEKYPVIFYK